MLYSEYEDELIALVTYFSLTHKYYRKPSTVASDLKLDPKRVEYALDNFPALFWKSKDPKDNSQKFYTLHMRYATLINDKNCIGEDESSKTQLPSGYLEALLSFVSKKVDQEKAQNRLKIQNIVTMIGAWLAAFASITAALISTRIFTFS